MAKDKADASAQHAIYRQTSASYNASRTKPRKLIKPGSHFANWSRRSARSQPPTELSKAWIRTPG